MRVRLGVTPLVIPPSGVPWVECVHNSRVLLFTYQEGEVAVPSVWVNLHRCGTIRRQVHESILRFSLQAQRQANHRRIPAPTYCPGQKVWPSSKALRLQVKFTKLAPCCVVRTVNAAAVCLKLPSSSKVHPMFHVSRVKSVRESELPPLVDNPPPVRIINGAPVYMVQPVAFCD